MNKTEEKIYQAIGEASMCWNETPKGVYDSEKAKKIGDALCEEWRLQMAGISTAAIGYWKEEDSIHPDYDTVALRDVAKLYQKYAKLYNGIQCGQRAILKIEKMKGMITGICNRFDRIQYEFSYVHNGDVKTIWLNENEFTILIEVENNIGFSKSEIAK